MTTGPYSIGKAAQLLGVSVTTLRRWDRIGLLRPFRTPGGQRRYTQTDINTVLCATAHQHPNTPV
jgi:excisionase family DNA binding protein